MTEYKKTVFVFGSNRQGKHGAGAALEAVKKYGARNGKPRGLQGNSYAIVTKELREKQPPVTVKDISKQVARLTKIMEKKADWLFNVTAIGCGLAGFSPSEIGPMFWQTSMLPNVKLPVEFCKAIADVGPTRAL